MTPTDRSMPPVTVANAPYRDVPRGLLEFAEDNPYEAGLLAASMSGVVGNEPVATIADGLLTIKETKDAYDKEGLWPAIKTGAIGTALTALPFAPAALMFAGKGAKTADLVQLRKAEDLEKAGKGADDIWRETGWGRGADGEWRFEIDDSGAYLEHPKSAPSGAYVLRHDDVAAAHPDRWNGMQQSIKSGPAKDGYKAYYNPKDNLLVVRGDGAHKSSALHETQHMVQGEENFARGGNLLTSVEDEFSRVWDQKMALYKDLESRGKFDEINKVFMDPAHQNKTGAEILAVQRQIAEKDPELKLYFDLSARADELQTKGFVDYSNLAGEVEARNVQHRMDWTPEQRRETPPWATEDVPRDQQIVRRGLLGDGPQMSADLPMDEASRMARADEHFPIDAYHGTARLDRLLENSGINPKRATSGPMPFFTDSPGLSSSYATGKKGDTSRALEGDGTYGEWFKVRPKGSKKDIPFDQAWYRYDPAERARLTEELSKIGYIDDDYSVIGKGGDNVAGASADHWDYTLQQHRGNALAAARDVWLDSGQLFGQEEEFEKVLGLAGVGGVKYDSPHLEIPGVLPARLRITNPLHTDTESVSKVLPILKEAGKRKRGRSGGWGVDQWDKNSVSGPEWIARLEDDIKHGTTHAWTSIPDWATEALKKEGFDGIIDQSGKGGGDVHKVFIPFEANQVRSRFAKFDPRNLNSSDLLAGIAGAGLLGIGARAAMPSEDERGLLY